MLPGDDPENAVGRAVRRLVPSGVAVEARTIHDYVGDLTPEEFRLVRDAVGSRQLEFSTGRACAHAALGRLGVGHAPLLQLPDRSPDWPPGMIGSISHSHDICISVVAAVREVQSIGIDIEKLGGVDISMYPLICGPRELAVAAALPRPMADKYVTLIFSGKEALYKCDATIRASDLGFQDVQLETAGSIDVCGDLRVLFREDNPNAGASASGKALGRWEVCGDYVITAFHVPATEAAKGGATRLSSSQALAAQFRPCRDSR